MKRKLYGKVLFKTGGEESARLQRHLTENMAVQGVITVDRLQVEKWFNEDRINPVGCTHCIVLHNRKEEDIFRTIMESEEMQHPMIVWKVDKMKNDRDFLKWVESVEKEIREDEELENRYNDYIEAKYSQKGEKDGKSTTV